MDSEDDDPLAIFAPKKPTPQRQAAQEKIDKAKTSLFGDTEVKRENPFINTCQEVKNKDYIVPEQLEEAEQEAEQETEKYIEKVVTPEKPKDSNTIPNKQTKTQSTLEVPGNPSTANQIRKKSGSSIDQPTNLNKVKIQKNPSPNRDKGKNSLFGLENSGQNSLSKNGPLLQSAGKDNKQNLQNMKHEQQQPLTGDYQNNFLAENNKHKDTIECVLRVTLGKGTKEIDGMVRVGLYMIHFIPKHPMKARNIPKNYFQIPWTMITKIKERKNDYNYTTIEICTKDARVITFCIPKTIRSDAREFSAMYEVCSRPNEYFAYRMNSLVDWEKKHVGWEIYDIEGEFSRQGLNYVKSCAYNFPYLKTPQANAGEPKRDPVNWRLILNKNRSGFRICQSYPWMFVVPLNVPEQVLTEVIAYRSKQRIPILSYFWKNPAFKDGGVTLWRSAQSLSGYGTSRSYEDEFYLLSLDSPSTTIDFNGMKQEKNNNSVKSWKKNIHVFDCRPYSAAWGNKLAGKGYEDEKYYDNMTLTFHDIQNAPTIGTCHKDINKTIVNFEAKDYLDSLAKSNWIQYIARILMMVKDILTEFKLGVTSQVHCSDGWDRTSQVCSLIQLVLDPYFRTYKGFAVLIEKDWVAFGHQFNVRQAYLGPKCEEKEQSPIFLQFLDCVHQLWVQNPTAFEFNMDYLRDLAYYSYSGVFGTFIYNNDAEREKCKANVNTISVWSYMFEFESKYLNKFYDKSKTKIQAMRPYVAYMRFWSEYFMQYAFRDPDNDMITMDPLLKFYKELVEKNELL